MAQQPEEEGKDDIVKYWPVFGRESGNGKHTSFWQKAEVFDLDPDDVEIEGYLSRIGRKNREVKNYYYKLCGSYLCYYINKDDQDYKGYLKLTKEVLLEKKQLKGKNEDYFYLEFSKDSNMRKLYTKQADVVKQWFTVLREKCALTGFKDHYKRIELLGSGSFATVYKVLRLEDSQLFAAKIYHKEKLEENKYKDKFVQMMLNEYETLRLVDHECIASLYEVFQESDYCAYVMEYVSGGEIYARLRQLKRFSEEQAAQIMKDITSGLLCLHHHKYVHRDLKLENIMMIGGNDFRVKLIDFGFAELICRDQLMSKSGTPGFLPPELFKMQPYTEKGDIFSLGIILYCLVSGQSPFKGKTYKEVLENNRKCNISYDSFAWSKVTEECKQLIRNMVEPHPSHRYNTKDILKSPWMTKYYQWEGIEEILTMKSFKSTKSLKSQKNRGKSVNNSEDEEGSDYSQEEFQTSTMLNWRGEDGPKSFYRRSMKSMKSVRSIKSVKSNRNLKTEYSDSSLSVPSSENENNITTKMNLNQNYGKICKQDKNKKLMDSLSYQCNVEVSDDNDLNIKIKNLKVPEKRFMHYTKLRSVSHMK